MYADGIFMSNCEILDVITTAGNRGLVQVDDSHVVCIFVSPFQYLKHFTTSGIAGGRKGRRVMPPPPAAESKERQNGRKNEYYKKKP